MSRGSEILAVTCPWCRAKPNTGCRPRGNPTMGCPPHQSRVAVADGRGLRDAWLDDARSAQEEGTHA